MVKGEQMCFIVKISWPLSVFHILWPTHRFFLFFSKYSPGFLILKIVSYYLILRPLEYFEFKASPSLIFEPIYVLQSATSLSHILPHWFQSMKSDIKMILTLHMSRLLNIYFSKFKNSEVASVFLTTQTIYQLEPDVP